MQNMNDQINNQHSSRDVLYVLFKHKTKIIFFFLAVMGIIGITTLLTPKIYQSEAKLFIKLGRETMSQNSDASGGHRISVSQSLESQINSEIEILKSKEVALKVVDNIGVDSFQENAPQYKPRSSPVVVKLRQIFKFIKAIPEIIITNFLTHSDPYESITATEKKEKAASQISNNLQVQIIGDSNVIKLSFESQSPRLSKDVLDQLIALYLEMHMKLLGTPESFEFFKKESIKFRMDLEATEKKIQELKNEIGSGYATSSVNELNNVLYELKLREQELLSTFTEISIPVKEIRRQIQKTENEIEAQLKSNNEAEVRLVQLEREKELLEKNYRKYSDTLEQTRIDQALEAEKISNVRIAQAPNVPLEPIRPRSGVILGLGFFLGIFGGLGLAFFIEYMDGSLQKPEQIEEILDIPVLGSIQEMRK